MSKGATSSIKIDFKDRTDLLDATLASAKI